MGKLWGRYLLASLVVIGALVPAMAQDVGVVVDLMDPVPDRDGGAADTKKVKVSDNQVCELTGLDFNTGQCFADITGKAVVTRNTAGITAVVNTSNFEKQEALTLWWFILDTDGDTVFGYAAGKITGGQGGANFAAHINAGEEILDPMGVPAVLDDPLNSIVVLVVRTHGPKIPGMVDEQIHTFNGGCNPGEPNEGLCFDRQATVHLP